MMYGNYPEDEPSHRDSDKNYRCIKNTIHTFNIVLLILCLAILGGSIYILIEKTFISDIIQNQLLTIAVWLIILGGSLLFLSITICGFVGVCMEKKKALMAYIGLLMLLFLVFLGAGICAIIMRGELGNWVILKMAETLKDDYGVNLDNHYNQFITYQWDKAQKDMQCCGVGDQSWGIYRQSNWYAEQPSWYGDARLGNQGKALVPVSCCKRDRYNKVMDSQKCQRFMEGPPYRRAGEPGINQPNSFLHYSGCYEAGKRWIRYNGSWIIGFGIGFAFLLFFATVLSMILVMRFRN